MLPDRQEMGFQGRLYLLCAALLGFALILVGRLVYWQVLPHEELETGEAYQEGEISPLRGMVLDREGHFLVLNTYKCEVTAAPNQMDDPEEVARALEDPLGRPWQEIWEVIRDQEKRYARLAPFVSAQAGKAIVELDLPGVTVEPKPQRFYLLGEVAAHLFGFVNLEGKACYGLEEFHDERLRGRPGVGGREVIVKGQRFVPPRDGSNLVLTLDRSIQYKVEAELERAIQRYEATGGTILVVDPGSGAILAMASRPSYDPNDFATTPLDLCVNPALSYQYEPGSVLKIVTMAAGLDTGAVTRDSTYYDKGKVTIQGQLIEDWDRKAHGWTTMTEVLQHSLNLGAVHVANQVGAERFYEYLRRFGFGQPTGVDLAGEITGLVRTPEDASWSELDLATNAFGQGIAVTPLQVTAAVAAVANGGVWEQPHVVDHMVAPDGSVTPIQRPPGRQVVSPQTAEVLTQMLVEAVEKGMEPAVVPGVKVAGKTGTAQIPDLERGGYEPKATIASFVGYAPADEPRFVLLVKIDRPKVPRGLEAAAPVFKAVAEWLLAYMEIPPSGAGLASR
jgi:cell division protein FtsI (penicillin-binding protein 3)